MLIPLKELRDRAKMTQADLAKALNVAPSTVGMWEQGRNEPSYAMLKRLSAIFNVTTDYLLNNEVPTAQSTAAEKRLLDYYRDLDETGQNLLTGLLDSLRQTHPRGSGLIVNTGSNYGVVGGNFSSKVTIS